MRRLGRTEVVSSETSDNVHRVRMALREANADSETALLEAAEKRDVAKLTSLLQMGVYPNVHEVC